MTTPAPRIAKGGFSEFRCFSPQTVAGGFSPLTISLSGTSGATVSPQSMLFINSLGQLAVVDGLQQGLVLIDLNTVAFSTNYF